MRTHKLHGLILFVLALLLPLSTIDQASAADYRPLIGRWQRTDGGYVSRESNGWQPTAAMAGSLLQSPADQCLPGHGIHVFKDHLKVEIELRDTGYPGLHLYPALRSGQGRPARILLPGRPKAELRRGVCAHEVKMTRLWLANTKAIGHQLCEGEKSGAGTVIPLKKTAFDRN
jgi:hypothetical protein